MERVVVLDTTIPIDSVTQVLSHVRKNHVCGSAKCACVCGVVCTCITYDTCTKSPITTLDWRKRNCCNNTTRCEQFNKKPQAHSGETSRDFARLHTDKKLRNANTRSVEKDVHALSAHVSLPPLISQVHSVHAPPLSINFIKRPLKHIDLLFHDTLRDAVPEENPEDFHAFLHSTRNSHVDGLLVSSLLYSAPRRSFWHFHQLHCHLRRRLHHLPHKKADDLLGGPLLDYAGRHSLCLLRFASFPCAWKRSRPLLCRTFQHHPNTDT